jgi:hypothetical protein
MPNGSSVNNELSALLAGLRADRKKRQEEVDVIDQRIAAVETTLGLLRQRLGLPQDTGPDVSDLLGKTQLDALVTIAEKNDGYFKVQEAKRLMLRAGLIRNPKNANSILYTLLGRHPDRFERVGPGEFRLIGAAPGETGQTRPRARPPRTAPLPFP